MKKRIFSLLLAILMVTSMIPANTFAEGTDEIDPGTTAGEIISETTASVATVCEECGTDPCTCTVITDICLIGYLNQDRDISFFDNKKAEKVVAAADCPQYLILTQKIIKKSLVQDEQGNSQLVETVLYKTDSLDDNFWSSVVMQYAFTGAQNFTAITSAVGLYATFGSAELTLQKDLAVATDVKTAVLPDEYIVADFLFDASLGNWFVKLAPGENWPTEVAGYVWTYASSLATLTQKSTHQPKDDCDICGKTDCGSLHFYCEICKDYDCGKAHLHCPACGTVDCGKAHTFCGYCNGYDCGIDHSDVNKPVSKPVIPANPTLTPGADVSVVDEDGNSLADGLFLIAGTKTSISAWPNAGGDASYQWQICVDGQWIDIQGQKNKGLLISPAMVLSAMEQGSAQLRCAVTVDGETKTSESIPVSVVEPIAMAAFNLTTGERANNAETTVASEEDNKVNVIINYVFTDNSIAANPWAATLPKGEAYTTATPISVPSIQGYKPTLGAGVDETKVILNDDGKLTLNFTKEDLAADQTVNIVFQPAPVKVVVNHHWQNVDNDNYTLHETVQTTAVTGTQLGDVHKTTYEGFYHLLYEHPIIAADGSTVVDVYYDRYYYLMTFDLSGGYDVEPVYARFGAPIKVGTPTRPGYTFQGWSLNGEDADIPTTMPGANRAYAAKWGAEDTEYARAYWVEHEDGTKTYIGSEIVGAMSGEIVSGSDTLTADTYVCGKSEHNHDASCEKTCTLPDHTHGDGTCDYNCGKEFHDHTSGCNCNKEVHSATEHTRDCYSFNATVATNATDVSNQTLYGSDNGFNIYHAYYYYGFREGYFVLIGDSYYRITDYSKDTSLEYTFNPNYCHYHTSACCSVEEHTHSADCCSVHAHGTECYSCGEVAHTHSDTCKTDLYKYVQYKSAVQEVTVDGDGSSIVNVYYEYKTYTIRFLYAREYSGTYYISYNTRDGHLEGSNNGTQWTDVSFLPTFTDPSGKTERSVVKIGNYNYYYIALKAKYGADIASIWPDNNIGSIGNWTWGSWAAAPGTGYRIKYGDDHANIVGPYPTMSADMIVDNPEKLDDGSYLAQNMVAWWGTDYYGTPADIEAHTYHNYFELLPTEDQTGAVEHNGKYYKLVEENSFTFTAAHNGTTRVDPIYFTGFKCVNDTSIFEETDPDKDIQRNSVNFYNKSEKRLDCSVCGNIMNTYPCDICGDACDYCNTFYYDRNVHKIYFWNHNGYLQGGTGSDMPYGASLVEHGRYVSNERMSDPENYPDGLEPGAYEFEGWYTTSDCLDGTEMDWNTTMPDSDFTVYAKWVPVKRTVRFFLDTTDMENQVIIPERMAEVYAKDHDNAVDDNSPYAKFATRNDVPNRSFLLDVTEPGVSEGYDSHPYKGYNFIGWFYIEDGEEKAFDPANMPVTQDLDLYGKWSYNVLCSYEIRFVLDDDGDGVLDANETTYVADPVTGSTLAGNSRTFNAKGDTALYADYQSGYYPNVASHTIDFKASDEKGVIFTFLYKSGDPVEYTVRYLEKGTDRVLADPVSYPQNTKAVVTENFKAISGYIPDAYQKTLAVVPGGKNEIIFYYTEDTAHALYQINHYVQNLDGETWSEYRTAVFTGELPNKIYSASAITIPGFTFSVDDTREINLERQINAFTNAKLPGAVSFDGGDTVSGILTANGMQLNLYYTRNVHQYRVQYLEYGTGEVLADEKTVTGVHYGSYVTENAIAIEKDLDGDGKYEDFQLYEATDSSQSATIVDDTKVFVFYYIRCTAEELSVTKTLTGDPSEDISFNFALTSTAADFTTHSNGTYRYEIKNGEAIVDSGYQAVTGGDTIAFSLKEGQTITFFGLPTAMYTVTEQPLPLGYYCTEPERTVTLTKNEKQSITVANEYAPASLAIRKVVDHVEEVADNVTEFTFYITVPTGVNGSHSYTVDGEARSAAVESNGRMTITLKENETALFSNLPLGQYTVTEQDYTSEGYSATYVDTDGTTTDGIVTLDKGDAHTVTCTNAYPVGSLTIEKTVQKAYANDEWTGDTFKFTIIRRDGVLNSASYPVYSGTTKIDDAEVQDGELVVDIDFTELGTKTIKIDNLPKGTYEVIETANDAYIQTSSNTNDPSNLTVTTSISPDDYAGKAEFTNIYKKHLGDLSITKTVTALEGFAAPEDDAFTFTVSGDAITKSSYKIQIDGASADCAVVDGKLTLQLKHGQTAIIKDLDMASYIVTETITDGFVLTDSSNASGTISAEDSAKAEFTNTYVPRGNLKVTKYIDRNVYENIQIDTEQDFTFTVTLAYPLSNVEKYTAKIYTVGSEDPVISELPLSADKKLTFTLKHNQHIVIENLPAVGYKIEETQLSGYLTPFYVDDAAGTIPADGTKEVVCYNPVELAPGDLSITKIIEDTTMNNSAPKGMRFEFTIMLQYITEPKSTDGVYEVEYTYDPQKGALDTQDGVITYTPNGGEAGVLASSVTIEEGDLAGEYYITLILYDGMTATIKDLPPSAYYVYEKDYSEENFEAFWSGDQIGLLGGVKSDGQNPQVKLTCTNTYPIKSNGKLAIKKQVTKDYARDVLPGDTFTFTVTPTDGNALEGEYTVKISDVYVNEEDAEKVADTITARAENNQLVVEIPFTAAELVMGLNDSRTKLLTIEGLPLGAYQVEEAVDAEYRQITRTHTVNVGTNPGEVTFINRYKRHLGNIQITKNLDAGSIDDGSDFLFHILDSEKKVVMSVTLKAGETKKIWDLPIGVYTVREDTSWNWRYTLASSNDVEANLNNDETATVTFTNTNYKGSWLTYIAEKLNQFTNS